METDPDTVVPRRLGEELHGATLLTLHCDAGRPGKPFGANVVARLGDEGLLGHVLWSTSCAPRDVDADVFRDLRDSGLYLVRLELDGIAGDAARLRELVVVVHSLRQLGLLVTYDLDLFDGRLREKLVCCARSWPNGTIPAVLRCGPLRAVVVATRVDGLTDSMLALHNRFLGVNADSPPAGGIRR